MYNNGGIYKMGFLEGLFKIAGGVVSSSMGGACSDGPAQFCPKCGSIYHGVCTNCATKKGAELIDEGIKDIKSADKQIYIDAEKRGYVKASEEYKTVFNKIQEEYSKAKQEFERIIRDEDSYSEHLISQYEELVLIRKRLEAEVEKRAEMIADKCGISTNTLMSSISDNLFSITSNYDLLSILRNYQEKKMLEAECKGYARAKKNYEKKIYALKQEFEELQSLSNQKIEEIHSLITDVLNAISDEHMKIAALKIIE